MTGPAAEELDLVRIYHHLASWRWERRTPDGVLLAESSHLYSDHREAVGSATSCNRHPYVLRVELAA